MYSLEHSTGLFGLTDKNICLITTVANKMNPAFVNKSDGASVNFLINLARTSEAAKLLAGQWTNKVQMARGEVGELQSVLMVFECFHKLKKQFRQRSGA